MGRKKVPDGTKKSSHRDAGQVPGGHSFGDGAGETGQRARAHDVHDYARTFPNSNAHTKFSGKYLVDWKLYRTFALKNCAKTRQYIDNIL